MDTLYRCTVCGRVGTVGRCCGDETREPLNDLARRDQEKIKARNLPKADAYSLLAEVRADIQELLKSIDEYHETFSTAELESFSRQKLDAGIKMMRLKNKISEHFS